MFKATNKTREIPPLFYLKENEAIFMLGMFLAPYGSTKYQFKYMHKKATTWETSIVVEGVQQNEAWKSLNPTTPQTTKCPLSDMTINKKECKHIMKPIVKCGLTMAGISSTLHTAVRYVSRILGGIRLLTPS